MNYRHHYHVGNFADVFKHILLVSLLQSFLKKETPFCYLETHAGIGWYDLSSPLVQKNPEYLHGIARLQEQSDFPEIVQSYLNIFQSGFYPGSPKIARHFLRPQDRMILSELHPEDSKVLKQLFKGDRQVAVHHSDGYQSLKAFLPPAEKRGLVLIDPPYEEKDEWQNIVSAVQEALKRWRNGMFAIWYPIKDRSIADRFYRLLKKIELPKTLCVEFSVPPDNLFSALHSCGLIVINPPWEFDTQCKVLLPWLCQSLEGSFQVHWLIDEL